MEEIDAEEFSWWLAYYEFQPFGDDRDDLRAGMIGSLFANAWRKKGRARVGPDDLFPNLKREAIASRGRRQSIEVMAAQCRRITWAMGGTFQ